MPQPFACLRALRRLAAVALLIVAPAIPMRAAPSTDAASAATAPATTFPAACSVLEFPRDQKTAVIKLEPAGGLWCTREVKINGRSAGIFLVDTGSNRSVLDRKHELAGGLVPVISPSPGLRGQASDLYHVESLSLGSVTLRRHVVRVVDLASMSQRAGVRLAGILGGDILGRLPFTIDFRDGTLTLQDPDHFVAPSAGQLHKITLAGTPTDRTDYALANPHAGAPAAEARINDAMTRILLDTGATFHLVLTDTWARAHPECQDTEHAVAMPPQCITMRAPARYGQVQKLELLGRTLERPTGTFVVLPPPPESRIMADAGIGAVVGTRFLRNFRLTFDYANGRMWVEARPPLPLRDRLAAGLDPNVWDLAERTPLMTAAWDGKLDDFKSLLAAGAKLDASTPIGQTVLYFAAEGGNSEILDLVIAARKADDLNRATAGGYTALMAATGHPDALLVQKLLHAGADPDLIDSDGQTALHFAALHGTTDAAKALLQARARFGMVNRYGATPLEVAAECGSVGVLEVLLKAGSVLNRPRPDRCILLHWAARGGDARMVRHLLKTYPDQLPIDAIETDGTTPLMLAAQYGHNEAVELLLEAGADIQAVAIVREHATALLLATAEGRTQVVETLIKHKANLEAATSLGRTPLITAAGQDHVAALEALLKAGAKLEAQDSDGCTALHVAAREGHAEVAAILLKAGANVEATARFDGRPLHMACLNGRTEVARLLLAAGANPNVTTTDGWTPLKLVEENGNREIALLIRQKNQEIKDRPGGK